MEERKMHRKPHSRRFKQKILLIFLMGMVFGIAATLGVFRLYRTVASMQAEEENARAAEELTEPAEENGGISTTGELSENPMDIFKSCLQNGEPTSVALRKAISDEIVVASGGRYYFLPIDETLKKHNYSNDNLVLDEGGVLSYQEEGQTVSKKGIDVSRYQGEIDWERVRADGVEFAFIRAGIRGYGTGKLVQEEGFAENLVKAVEAGVDVGAYFFSQAVTEEEAVEEADLVIEALSGNGIPYPVVYDLERVKSADGRMNGMSKEEMTAVCLAFCNRIKDAGYTPMIYGNLETFCLMLDMTKLEEYPKWLAYYQNELYFPYDFQIWQYSKKGRVDGIKGDVDMNLLLKELY